MPVAPPPPAPRRRPPVETDSPPLSPSTLAYRVLLESPRERAADKVGATIRVRWDDGWYTGRVTAYLPASRSYRIEYEDGDWEVLPLDGETRWKGGGRGEGGCGGGRVKAAGRRRKEGRAGGGEGGGKGRKGGGTGGGDAAADDHDDDDDDAESVEFEVLHMPGSTDESSEGDDE